MITLILLSILFSSQLQYSIVKDFCFCSLYRQKHYEDSIMKHLLLSCFIRKVLWRFDSWRFCPWGGTYARLLVWEYILRRTGVDIQWQWHDVTLTIIAPLVQLTAALRSPVMACSL